MISRLIMLVIFSCACTKMQAQEIDIRTIGGIDTFGYSGDGGPAILAHALYRSKRHTSGDNKPLTYAIFQTTSPPQPIPLRQTPLPSINH